MTIAMVAESVTAKPLAAPITEKAAMPMASSHRSSL